MIPQSGLASDPGAPPPAPEGMELVKPKVMLALPCMSAQMDCATISGIMSVLAASGGLVVPYFLMGNSNIREARNKCANFFMRHTECGSCVWIDSDIGFGLQDFAYLMEGPEELVIAPYAMKVLGKPPVEHGFGFVRTNRSVFDKLDNWVQESGEEMLPRYYDNGEVNVDYFFTGATPDARWMGEDVGFFNWCAHLRIVPRRETRCRLTHYGRFGFKYPEQIPGYVKCSDVEPDF
jgi:hypothetical protein